VDFQPRAKIADRLKAHIQNGIALEAIKEELLHQMCLSNNWLHIDYWGCWVEAFPVEGPPGAISWEDFTASIRKLPAKPAEESETSGRYLLTADNVSSMLRSLEAHKHELTIMSQPEIDHLQRWQAFCRKHPSFCVVYQIDF
jgi:hypothetical protein